MAPWAFPAWAWWSDILTLILTLPYQRNTLVYKDTLIQANWLICCKWNFYTLSVYVRKPHHFSSCTSQILAPKQGQLDNAIGEIGAQSLPNERSLIALKSTYPCEYYPVCHCHATLCSAKHRNERSWTFKQSAFCSAHSLNFPFNWIVTVWKGSIIFVNGAIPK